MAACPKCRTNYHGAVLLCPFCKVKIADAKKAERRKHRMSKEEKAEQDKLSKHLPY